MKFQSILFFLASVALALFAGAFVGNLCLNVMALSQITTNAVTALVMFVVFISGYASDYLPQGLFFMALSAKNIKRNANPKNLGGLAQEHYYAFVEDIKTWPAGLNPDFLTAESFADLVTIAADDLFVMQPGKFFHTFPCLLEGGQVKSTRVGPIGSAGYEQGATFSNPDNEDDLKGHIVYIGNKPVIIIARELKGTLKVIGNKECPAYVEMHDIQNGEKVADGNSQKHGFKAYGSIPSPTYLGAIPVEPPPAAGA